MHNSSIKSFDFISCPFVCQCLLSVIHHQPCAVRDFLRVHGDGASFRRYCPARRNAIGIFAAAFGAWTVGCYKEQPKGFSWRCVTGEVSADVVIVNLGECVNADVGFQVYMPIAYFFHMFAETGTGNAFRVPWACVLLTLIVWRPASVEHIPFIDNGVFWHPAQPFLRKLQIGNFGIIIALRVGIIADSML